MDVEPFGEGVFQLRDVGHVGQHAQLDLAVVGGDQLHARLGDEGRADLAAFPGADRDVLQVGFGRGQAPRGGRGKRVAGMDAAGFGVDVLRQRVRVGALELGKLPPFEQLCGQAPRVLGQVLAGDEVVEHIGAGTPFAGCGFLRAGQAELPEQKVRDLLRRADIELACRQRVDLVLDAGEALANSPDSRESTARSTLTPVSSISPRTAAMGRSSVS